MSKWADKTEEEKAEVDKKLTAAFIKYGYLEQISWYQKLRYNIGNIFIAFIIGSLVTMAIYSF